MIEATQMSALLVAVTILMSYRSNGARYRGDISLVSGMMTATLAAWAFMLYAGMTRPGLGGMIVALLFLGLVVYCRGNVAKMLDLLKSARVWRR